MTPDTSLRLSSMLRALQTSIIPALPTENGLAIEQAQLLAGHINLLIQQEGRETEINKQEADRLRALATSLLAIPTRPADTSPVRQQLVDALQADSTTLSIAIDELILTEGVDSDFITTAWPLIMDYAIHATDEGRQWFKATGMW